MTEPHEIQLLLTHIQVLKKDISVLIKTQLEFTLLLKYKAIAIK